MTGKTDFEKIEMLREAFKQYFFEAGDELAAQPAAAPMPQGAPPAPVGPGAQAQNQVPTPDQQMDPMLQQQQQATPDYTVEQFIASLNQIRGGRSFDDQDVYQQITSLFTNLDPASKEALRNVIGQVESIVTPLQQDQQAQQAQQQLPATQDTQAYNNAVNAPPQAPPQIPQAFQQPVEAPPA